MPTYKPSEVEMHVWKSRSSEDNILSYIETLTPTEQQIIYVFLQYIHEPWVKLTNAYIAREVGCERTTVIRATNKFHRDGFINKHQKEKFSPNYFTFSDKIRLNN